MKRSDLVPETYHHIVLRGSRGMDIFLNEQDWWECNKLLYHLNDVFTHQNWKRDLVRFGKGPFHRPPHWPPRQPLVNICAYCIHTNHIHLLIHEFHEGGISNFMRRLPKSLTHRYNRKYGGCGSVFQGPYQARIIESDADLRNVSLYIMAKNVMERFPNGGTYGALENYELAWKWANSDNFSSFPDFGVSRNSPILNKTKVAHLWTTNEHFKKDVFDYLHFHFG